MADNRDSGNTEETGKDAERRNAELLEEHRKTVEELRQSLYEKEEKLRELEDVQRKYDDAFAKIKRPPLLYGYVVRTGGADLESSQVVVARGSELLKVDIGTLRKEDLKTGQYVWVHPQTYAVVESTEFSVEGLVARVVEVMDDRLVINLEGEMQKRIIRMPERAREHIKVGDQVSVLPPTFDVVDIIPNWEVKLLLLGERPEIRYAQIGGLGEAIERIRDVIELPYKEPELFKSVRLKPPRGILLYGPPGCGKTLLVKAVAGENSMTFFNVSVADILSKWVGESERIVKELFRQARERKPSIIFFDEIEALFTTRGLLDTSGVHKNIIAQILSEMDGLIGMKDVYVLGATNRPDLVDPALLRPGRFDEIIEIPRPNRASAEGILKIYLTDDLPVEPALVQKHGGREKAAAHLREFLIEELYGEDKWIKVKVDEEAKEGIRTVKRKDIISGAIIEAIVTTAKKNFVKRVLERPKKARGKDGISADDITRAVEEECKEHAITEVYTIEKRQRELFKQAAGDPMVR